MALSSYSELLGYARERKFTVGAFNSFNMESLQAVVSAADRTGSPLIVQTYHAHMDFAGADYMRALCETASRHAKVKVALGLDHGKTYEQAVRCIEAGYSGVMIDLSSEDYAVNVAETKRVAEAAHARGVSVEAEIGKIFDADATPEEIATGYTDPDLARRFVEETRVDCLAVSIGTAHGFYTHAPKVNFDLLEEILRVVPCPIVVHGGSYTPDADVLRMVKMGVAKFNVGGEFFAAYKKTILGLLTGDFNREATEVMAAARAAIEKVALAKLKLLNAYRI
ncbi:MAG: class II fructose-bisphosphate aldolase [Planctomycetota bacterium]|jgi:ketose-bisphosphate aldolase|nr:class II fructose-bisphosphate aldolase [Planctomycetota bacterium]